MILNRAQQSNLFALANGAGNGYGGEIKVRVSGTDLIGVLNNQNRKTNNIR